MGDVDCELDCGDIDCGECLSLCCSSACDGGGYGGGAWPYYFYHNHNSAGDRCTCTCLCCCLLLLVILVVLLVMPYAVVFPVHVTVEDASLARLALAGPNGTALAYDVSLAIAVHNRNWASLAKLGAVDAELRFAGARIAAVRMQGEGSSGEIQPGKTDVYHVAAAGEIVQLGSDEVAEFVKQSEPGGLFRLELKLSGEVRYPPHSRVHRLEATCPLELPLSSPALTKKVKCVRLSMHA